MLIWITGCTQGLGLALTETLTKRGHTIVGCGRNEIAIQRLSEQLPNCTFIPCDVSDDGSVEDFVEEALLSEGAPDMLINNAAIINDPAPLWEIPAEEFDSLTAVNINGVANVIRHTVPAMLAEGAGIIVNISSGWGRSTAPEVAPYCASKWAIEGLTQALSQELPDGLAAIALNPGIINTDMLRNCFGEEEAASYPAPELWAHTAAPFIENLSPAENGHALTAP